MKRKTTNEFVEDAKKVHGDRYDYSESIYTYAKDNLRIICNIHGIFLQMPTHHLKGSGCFKCSLLNRSIKRKNTYNTFVNKSKKIHGNRYDYSKSKYQGARVNIEIVCIKHGSFYQLPTHHYKGTGCPLCGFESTKSYLKDNPAGWTTSSWHNRSIKSKYFDGFKVYIIMCWNDEELFFKVGRTFVEIKRRFKSLPYNYEIIEIFVFDNAKEAFDKETGLKRLNKINKYVPNIKFGGMQECFYIINQ